MSNRKFEWREGMPAPPVDADVFGGVVDQIEQEKGKVEPADVVEAARDPASPIHVAFDWNDATAAEKYRVQQARRYIGGLVVTRVRIDEGDAPTREFYSVRPTPASALAYHSRDKIASSEEMTLQVIKRARSEFEAVAKRYAGVLALRVPLGRIQEALDTMRDEADRLQLAAQVRAGRRPKADAGDDAGMAASA